MRAFAFLQKELQCVVHLAERIGCVGSVDKICCILMGSACRALSSKLEGGRCFFFRELECDLNKRSIRPGSSAFELFDEVWSREELRHNDVATGVQVCVDH